MMSHLKIQFACLLLFVAIRVLQKAHRIIPYTTDASGHDAATRMCSHIQHLDCLRMRLLDKC